MNLFAADTLNRYCFQILSRLKPAGKKKKEEEEKRKKQLPKLEEFLANRDYTGAITLLEVRAKIQGKQIYKYNLTPGHSRTIQQVHYTRPSRIFFKIGVWGNYVRKKQSENFRPVEATVFEL